MLGVGGSRRNLGRKALRGGPANGRVGGGLDPQAQKRELLRKLQEKRQEAETETETETGTGTGTGTGTEGTTDRTS
ncbi:DUF6243 family protein [Streptomyces sp. NBC_00024]|uniref:DUF6243 family protein n=1 Tax=Streptomyces sp. NBC_00024 TaxID=2903612 RepID=UPI00386D54A1